eukprot:TRINITY_DN25086_c0_g1_i1.p1 TRINITY_DN25086_c0_g1~~TRINITY_DN25086_c0_g1_i1.p1  ORF type:complete len:120 (-),score=36.54 TRINITY_DN25086_c0_g1_i1:24-383(-)
MNDEEKIDSLSVLNDPANQLLVIDADINELKNQIFHLKRSNDEMLEELRESGEDPVYREAIVENLKLIVKKKEKIARLEELRQELRRLEEERDAEERASSADGAGPPPEGGDEGVGLYL